MSCLREVQTISQSPHILPMPSLTRLTSGGVLNPLKNTTNTSHNELLHQDPLQPPLEPRDYEHMKAIHRHIFQDTFAWAGQERSAPMGGPMIKFGPDVSAFPDFDPRDYSVPHEYAPAGRQLTEAATHEYALLQEADYLRGLALSEFVDNLALRWVSLNVVHSFREGNTRSQLVFFSELAHHAGYHLDARAFLPPSREDRLAGVTNPVRERFVAARYYFQDYHDHTPMADTLTEVIAPLTEDQRRARPIVPIEER